MARTRQQAEQEFIEAVKFCIELNGGHMEHPDEAPQHDPKETVEEHATDQFTADKVDRELPDKNESPMPESMKPGFDIMKEAEREEE